MMIGSSRLHVEKPADDVERLNIDRSMSKCGKSGRFGNRTLRLDPAKTSAYVELE